MNFNNIIQYNEHWFDDVTLPTGIDRDLMKQNIILKCGLLQPLYGEPDLFQKFIGFWFAKKYWNIEKLIALFAKEYDPLENYNRTEDLHREYEDNGADQDKLTNNLSEGHTGTDETERKTSAMNESTYQPDNSEEFTHGEVISNTGTATTDKKIDHDGFEDAENHVYGNIGVTTSQQMWIQEKDLVNDNNIYDIITLWLMDDLFIGVY